MKKIFYSLFSLAILFTFTSCSEEDDTTYENIGSVVGQWELISVAPNVQTSNTLATAALNILLQTQASSGVPDAYEFRSDSTFTYYFIANNAISSQGEGTYSLVSDSLKLSYTDLATTDSYKIITANDSVLKVQKNYLTELLQWGADIIGGYTGVTVNSANATITYNIIK